MRRQNSRRPWRASNRAGVIPSRAWAPASKSASTPSQSRNRRGSALAILKARRLELDGDRGVDVLPAAVAQNVVAFARPAAGPERPGDVIGRSVRAVGGSVELDHQAFEAVLIVGAPDDPCFGLARQRSLGSRSDPQRDVVGNHFGIARRKALEQRQALIARQLPAGDGSGFGHAAVTRNAPISSLRRAARPVPPRTRSANRRALP